jgi:hypothetical protein
LNRVLVALALWQAVDLHAAETQISVGAEVGHHLGAEFSSVGVTQERTYVWLTGEGNFGDLLLPRTRLAVNTDLNLWFQNAQKTDVEIRATNVSWRSPGLNLTLGFQIVPWSHSFGFRIADVVNARDWTDPLFLDPTWMQRGVFALSGEVKISPVTLQLVASPFPTQNRYPSSAQGTQIIAPAPYSLGRAGADAEGGGRISVETEDHLNLSAFYYVHFNRNLVLNSVSSGGSPAYFPAIQRTHATGVGFSQTLSERWRIRGDEVVHFNQPYQSPALETPHNVALFQSILGTDYEIRGDWVLGAQHQMDVWDREQRHWLGGMVKRFWLEGQVITELFMLQGLGNPGLWWEPKVTWFFFKGWSLALALDYFQNWQDFNSNLMPLVGSGTRVFTWLTYRF